MYYLVTYCEVVVGFYYKGEETYFKLNQRGIDMLSKLDYSLGYPLDKEEIKGNIPLFDNRIRNASRFPGIEYSNNFMDAWRLYSINVRE